MEYINVRQKTYLLNILNEELGETIQRVSKAIRFGIYEIQEGQELTNLERIINELNDVLATIELLEEDGVEFANLGNEEAKKRKKLSIEKYKQRSIDNRRLY